MKLSAFKRKREKRVRRVCKYYTEHREEYSNATDLYNDIASKEGVHFTTVVRMLQEQGILHPRQARQ